MSKDIDKADILAYLDRLMDEIILMRKDIKEINQVFKQLPDIAEKDRDVISTFLSQIKNSVDDLKISLSNLELIIRVSFNSMKEELKKDLSLNLYKNLNNYFEKELPKILYVIEKTITSKQMELLKKSLEKELEDLFKNLQNIKEEQDHINKKINAISLLIAKNDEDKLKLFLLTTSKKEIKKRDLESLFGKETVKKVLNELKDKIDVKIV